jgi:hypothetical protein
VSSNQIDPKFFNEVSQFAHWGVMFSIALSLAVFFGWWGLLVAALGEIPYGIWHEYYYDPHFENVATRGSDTEDFCFLMLGLVSAALVFIVARFLGKL